MSDHTLPDPDAIEVRIGCERDNEAEEAVYQPCNSCAHHMLPMSLEPCATCVTNHYSKSHPNGTRPENDRWTPRTPTTKPADTDTSRGTCPTCGGSGTFGFDRNGSHSASEYREYECGTCHGTGVK